MQSKRITTSITAARRIGQLLREQRRQRRLTGEQVAQMAGISQSKVSKIENGYSNTIVIRQLETLLDILKPSKIIRQQISMLSFQLTGDSDTQFVYPFTDIPDLWNDLQKTTNIFRCYIVCGISAALQTVEYRAAYLKRIGFSELEVQAELARTMERQDMLWDQSKTYYFIMPEAALYTLPANFKVQTAQLDRLERVIGSKIVHIGIIPMQSGVSVFETGSFTIYDDRMLYVFMGDRVLKITDTETLLKYLNAFDELNQNSSFDSDALEYIRRASDYFAGKP